MIGWKSQRKADLEEAAKPKGFDDFELRLGDVMRGERATLGKSLLDVQRELRIKANYIAAIENCDPSAFDTPGFIAGYVRSYARYLNMDPDETFAAFCAESGFSTAHGMSAKASSLKSQDSRAGLSSAASGERDMFTQPSLPFTPENDRLLSRIEPAAIGSTFVLLALIGGIGYGGWSVLQEVQRVQLAPIDQAPVVLSDLDPLNGVVEDGEKTTENVVAGIIPAPKSEGLDRLYRPQALDVPVLVARDAPISTLDPASSGAFAGAGQAPALPSLDTDSAVQQALASLLAEANGVELAEAQPVAENPLAQPKVLEDGAPGVMVVAVRPAWVRVKSADGSTLFEGTMNAGDTYPVPQLAEAPNILVGESGAIYFAMNGQTYGPAGTRGQVTNNLALSVDALTARYQVADATRDVDLGRVVAELNGVAE